MSYVTHPDILISIRWLMALVFMTAAVGKMRHWSEFSGVLANYRLLPTLLVKPIAYVLPPVEAALSVALLAAGRSFVPVLTAMALLALFGAAMAINLTRGRRAIDCGCFQTHLKQTLRWALVARNAVLVGLLGVLTAPLGLASPHTASPSLASLSLPSPGAASLGSAVPLGASVPAWVTANGLLAGTAAFLILQSLNALWAIVPPAPRRAGTANAASPAT
jgi:hypothetical protein